MNQFETTANSRYDSLQVQVRGRFHRHLQYSLAYTLSKATDDVSDVFDPQKKTFECDPNVRPSTTHLPWIDRRSPSLVYINWYDEGVRVMDISNPFAPVFTGYFLSPRFGSPAGPGPPRERTAKHVFHVGPPRHPSAPAST